MATLPRAPGSGAPRRARSVIAVLSAVAVLCTGAVLAFAGTASAATLFTDTFDDGNIAGWSKSGGNWSVVADGGAQVATQSKVSTELARLFAGDAGWKDYAVQARVKPLSFSSAAGLVGLAARSSGSTTFVRLALLGSGKAQLQSVKSGKVTVLGTSSASFASGAWHTVRLELQGGTARGLVDGTTVATGSAPIAAGRIGLQTAGGTASFDDVLVADVIAGTPTTTPTTTAAPTPTTTSTTTRVPTPTTTPAPGGGTSPTAPWPTPTSSVKMSGTITVTGSLDGGLKRYYGIGDGGQSESQPPMFNLADGARLSNVILGAPAGDGVHCLGTCTLTNVWWEDVGEDAATFLGTSASQVMTIDGGGARGATDKVFQHNGPGTFVIKNFQVESFGKLYRSCGNCTTSYKRDVVIDNIVAKVPGKSIVGINTNFGDVAKLSRIVIVGDPSQKVKVCDKYKGVKKGSEPTNIGSGPDSTNCLYKTSDVTYR